MADQYEWVQEIADQWWLVNDRGRVVRQVLRRQFLGWPEPSFRVLGGDGYTDHPTLEEAMDAAADSID
jgi:hypothetical protein